MALDAGWDEELLAVEMEELQNLGFDLGLTGFDETEIADLFDTNSGDTVKDDDFDLTTALEKAAFVQRGDIWTVGTQADVWRCHICGGCICSHG